MAREKDKKGKAVRPIKNANMIGAGNAGGTPKEEIAKGKKPTIQETIANIRAKVENPTTPTPTTPTPQQPQKSQPQQAQQKPAQPVTKSIAQKMSDQLKATPPKPEAQKTVAPVAAVKTVAQKMSDQLKTAKEQPPKAQNKEVKPVEKTVQKEVKKPTPKAVKPPNIKR
jgi:hypothetical protein